MVFPSSVNQSISTTRKKRQPRIPRPITPGEVHDDIPPGVGVGGTTLDYGRLGGVTLVQDDGKWAWDWASKITPRLRMEVEDEGVLMFPGQRNSHPAQIPLTLDETLRSTNEFLEERLELYDQLGVRELVSRQIREDLPTTSTKPFCPSLGIGDVYDGTKLVMLYHPKSIIARNLVCFPFGPLGNQLNVSPFLPSSNAQSGATGVTRFVPTATPVKSFPTAILQISASPVVSSNKVDRDAMCIAVRLQSFSYLFRVIPNHTYLPPTPTPPVSLEEIGSISIIATTGIRHVDIALDPVHFGRALIVDELGGVTLWTEQKVERNERQVSVTATKEIRQAVTTERDSFFRIAWGAKPGTALVMSRTELIILDLEGDSPAETLLTLQGDGRMFTSIDKTAAERKAAYTVVCTTYEVIWLDEDVLEKPVLSWTHEYGGGKVRDLEVTYMKHDDDDCILLSSRSEKNVMVFHVPSFPPIYSLHPPYILPLLPDTPQMSSLGYIRLQRHSNDTLSPTQLVRLTRDGGMWSVPIPAGDVLERSKKGRRPVVLDVQWDDAVRQIARDDGVAGRAGEEVSGGNEDDIYTTRYRELNLKWLWTRINEQGTSEEQARFSLEEFEQHLRELDAPFEHIMTAAHLARDIIHGEFGQTRWSLLRPLHVDTDLTFELDEFDMTRHLSLVSTYSTPTNLKTAFPLLPPNRMNNDVAARQKADLERLSTDLALSRYIVHSEEIARHPPQPSDTQTTLLNSPEDLFAQAASQLSLKDKDPPPIKFTFLTQRPTNEDPNGTIGDADPLQSVSARALMEEWTVGADARAYEWKSWTDNIPQPSRTSTSERIIRPLPTPRSPLRFNTTRPSSFHSQGGAESQPQPPRQGQTLRAAASLPSLVNLPPVVARSSPPRAPLVGVGMIGSQGSLGDGRGEGEMVVQTQVEPGKFGGRNTGGGKKKVKKRAGGF